MSDENQTPDTPNAPAESNATPAASEPTFSAADVERILAADRDERAASAAADDPVARFRSTVNGSKLYAKQTAKQPQQPQGNSELSELTQLMKLQLTAQMMAMKPPAPPAPPKPMSVHEKLQSTDETIWLKRGNPNAFTDADRQALVQHHAAELQKQGYAYDVESEARARAAHDIAQAGRRALANIRLTPGGGGGISASFDANAFLGVKSRR